MKPIEAFHFLGHVIYIVVGGHVTCLNLRSLAEKAGAEVLTLLLHVKQQRDAPIAVDTHPRKTRRTRPRINVPSRRQRRDIGRNWLSWLKPTQPLEFFLYGPLKSPLLLKSIRIGYFKGKSVSHLPRTVQVYTHCPGVIISDPSFHSESTLIWGINHRATQVFP